MVMSTMVMSFVARGVAVTYCNASIDAVCFYLRALVVCLMNINILVSVDIDVKKRANTQY